MIDIFKGRSDNVSHTVADNCPLDLSVVIRCGRDEVGLRRCLRSIDANVEIIISAADNVAFLREPDFVNYRIALHQYGNWSRAAQSGIDVATNNDIIIMDADSVFGPSAIARINTALKTGHLIVQPRIVFIDDGSRLSRVVSNARTFENRYEPKAYSPGLGLKVRSLVDLIGVDGNVYNPEIAFGDDGDLDQRRRQAGIEVYVERDALIYHNSIKSSHELRTAFQFGRGEYQTQHNRANPKTLANIFNEEFVSDRARRYYLDLVHQYGLETALFMLTCRFIYSAGFLFENRKMN